MMASKKRNNTPAIEDLTGVSVPVPDTAKMESEPQTEDNNPNSADIKDRISIALLPDGSFDIESMREKTRAKFEAALAKTPMSAATEADTASPEVALEHCRMLYMALGRVEVFAAGLMGYRRDLAARVLPFSEAEIQALSGPTSRVMKKYMGGGALAEHRDLILLGVMLTSTVSTKFATLKAMQLEAGQQGTAGPVAA